MSIMLDEPSRIFPNLACQFREQMANWRRRTCKVIVISALERA